MYHQGKITHKNLPAVTQSVTIPIEPQTNDPTSFYHGVFSEFYYLFKKEIQEAASRLPPFPPSTESKKKYFYLSTITCAPVEITSKTVVNEFQGSLKTFELVFQAEKYESDHPPPRKSTKTKKKSKKYAEVLSTSDEELYRTSSDADIHPKKKKKN